MTFSMQTLTEGTQRQAQYTALKWWFRFSLTSNKRSWANLDQPLMDGRRNFRSPSFQINHKWHLVSDLQHLASSHLTSIKKERKEKQSGLYVWRGLSSVLLWASCCSLLLSFGQTKTREEQIKNQTGGWHQTLSFPVFLLSFGGEGISSPLCGLHTSGWQHDCQRPALTPTCQRTAEVLEVFCLSVGS